MTIRRRRVDESPPDDRAGTLNANLSRRAALGWLGSGVLAGAAGGVGATLAATETRSDNGAAAAPSHVAFFGTHQAGVVTPAQDRLHFAAFDLSTTSRPELIQLLQRWTVAAAALCGGHEVGAGAVAADVASPPDDTGEALGLAPSNLTLTIGFGPSLFRDAKGQDRFGLGDRRPAQLAELPTFASDALDPTRTGGDLCVQACADDPQVAVHAIRNLARIAHGVASVRYSQLGFGRTSSTSTAQATPRNMMGFKDGTANLKAENHLDMDRHVWVQPGDGPAWMTGGTYLVSRRIRMLIEAWDSTPLGEQERVIGRKKGTGAPLGATQEFDQVDLAATGADGSLLVDQHAHVRLAHPTSTGGATLLRRGYSFVDGTDGLGRLDAGLFFLAYQRDPRSQFVTINTALAGKHNDALNEYIQHVGSGVFACPPGVAEGEWWGQALLTS